MSKKMTLNKLIQELQALADEGHGNAQVLTGELNTPRPRLVGCAARYIGPSEWDNATWTFGQQDAPGTTVVL